MTPKEVIVLGWPDALSVLENSHAEPKPLPDKSIKIKNPDGIQVDNGYTWVLGKMLTDAIKVKKHKDIEKAVQKKLGPGDCLRTLYIVGHHSAGALRLGCGMTPKGGAEPETWINGNEAEWDRELANIARRFCPDAQLIDIYLLGCDTAICQIGSMKMLTLARLFKQHAPLAWQGKVRVHGSKRVLKPIDVKEIIDKKRGKEEEFLIYVESDTDVAVGNHCIIDSFPGSGSKPKPPDEDKALHYPLPEDFQYLAFPDKPDDPIEVPLPQPVSVRGFLELFDFDHPYDPDMIGAATDGYVALAREDGTQTTFRVTLTFSSIEYSNGSDVYLYSLADYTNRELIRRLLEQA